MYLKVISNSCYTWNFANCLLFRSFFTQAGEFSCFYLINGLCYVQVFLKVNSFFSGDDKSPMVAGFWHFVSLLVLERSSYARDQLRPSFGTLCSPLST